MTSARRVQTSALPRAGGGGSPHADGSFRPPLGDGSARARHSARQGVREKRSGRPDRSRPKPGPVGLRAFARAQGLTLSSIQRAIASGRLTPASVGRVKGRPVILDPAKAVAELQAHTRPRIDSRKAHQSAKPSALAAATLRERVARAEAFELETARKKRLLVPVAGVEQLVTAMVVQARTAMLGLPTRARQRIPHLTAADMTELERLVREILEEMADAAQRIDRRAG